VFEAVLKRFQRVSAGGGVPLEKNTRLAVWLRIEPSYCKGQNIPEEWTQPPKITISRSVNNSLSSLSVAGSQISSQGPENRSFTSSNLPLSLLHHA